MTKRINELAIQAGGIWQGGYVEQDNGDSVYTEHKFVHGGDMDVEQFARLLVKECIEIVEPCKCGCRLEQEVAITDSIIADIKEHFGVEE
jgi:hypothetical protein